MRRRPPAKGRPTAGASDEGPSVNGEVPPAASRDVPLAGGGEVPLGAVGIEEAARLVGVSPSAIRSWERQGLVSPMRTRGGVRRYGQADLDRLRAIRSWRAVDGLNAAAIRRLVAVGAGPAAVPGAAASIADRLRAARATRRMTLRDAAERSGLSASFISALEHGLSGASVAALRRLLDAYDTTLAAIVGPGPGSETDSGNGGDARLVAASARHAVEAGGGVRIENLADGFRLLEPQLFVLAPGASSNGPYSHPGEEFMYVLEGALGVWLDGAGESYRLEPGDSLTFPSTTRHSFQALGATETRVLWVNTPPTF